MKIYCIKIDCMPFGSDALQIQKIVNGKFVRQVSSCFTQESLIQLWTGKMSSEIVPEGMGYNYLDHNKPNWRYELIHSDLIKKNYKLFSRNSIEINHMFGISDIVENTSVLDVFDNKEYVMRYRW